ncbi:hypothetical protein ACFQGE_08040 [Halomicroarcula sp. GCM10025817]|uniref:PspA-associated protein PspAB n=1 Tax=Haloarcula TaxID=2237 RepID=UPI0023E84D28|nr:hypothetical protein [Halomicroarcula sp. SYNS111]
MGLLDGLKSALGMKAEADATRDADPDDLFGMSTAYITMEAELGYEPTGEAALCFADVDNTDFRDAMEEVESILEAGKVETGTEATFETDDHGYQWIVFEDPDFEDLLTAIHFAADTLVERRYGSRLLAALFSFEREHDGQPAYWVYSFRRGAYYPFAPDRRESHERDSTAEFKLESNLDGEISIEKEKEYWYPLWPDKPGWHPWE